MFKKAKKSSKTTDLKIISGKFKGRSIKAPSTSVTHPMGSREKTALFNVLNSLMGPITGDMMVLDCYCGSGALGLEALSRGAKSAVFADSDPVAVQTTMDNITSLGITMAAAFQRDVKKLVTDDSDKALVYPGPYLATGGFDLIFVDPPYDNFPDSLDNLSPALSSSGVLVLSHPDGIDPVSVFLDLDLIETKSYAACNLSFFKHNY